MSVSQQEPWVHDDALKNWEYAIAFNRVCLLGLKGHHAEAEIDRIIKRRHEMGKADARLR